MAVASIRNFFLIAAFVAAGSLSASAAAPSAKIINEINELIVTSAGMIVLDDDVADARANCEKAQKLARKFDPDSYVASLIDVCFQQNRRVSKK